MSLYRMTMRRVKRIISWVLSLLIVALLAFGAYYVLTVGL